ncbi:MAG: D-alanyl-D-alanine carboxypeptidase [Alphaproteobacteria bacterium]|nr:D-alanyl-D-alanine carboxypeptidase [Alphaproteobacteria bacterium]MBO6629786.1 D-alanyl-D-alanine carboxypeptidase [Alphaproteobacteria bacterium]MDF1625040.1 D-alanyl-D-alanine carboxypeptidase [Parvibaculaceae bacterium]
MTTRFFRFSSFSVLTSLLAFVLAGFQAASLPAAAFETKASYAILMDGETGEILFEKEGDVLMAPASMTKLMTMTLLFEALKEGRLKLDDEFLISETAWRRGGAASGSSTMFAELNSRIKVEDLIRGVIIQSGNDACIAIAEGMSGSEEAFADEMTRRGRELGLTNATFRNSTGWPDPEHLMTARDLALLARHHIYDLGEYYHYYNERQFTWNGITQSNRNPLLYLNLGVDGLKTGHTVESGYGLVASGERNGRRLILVINGLNSEKERSEESERLLQWGFREFETYDLYAANAVVENAEVWQGTYDLVPLVVAEEVKVIMTRGARRDMKVSVQYEGPIPAPIQAGQQVGTLLISAPDTPSKSFPVYAGANVEQIGLFGRAVSSLLQMIQGE